MKISEKVIRQVESEAKEFFKGIGGCHDWDHIKRVKRLALEIGRKEGADLEILEVAALLHDICKNEERLSKGEFCHAQRGAEICRRLLKKYQIENSIIDRISHCISGHRYRDDRVPETIEAKVLYDADKLDAIGAIGVGRVFQYAGEIGARLHNNNPGNLENMSAYSKEDTAQREYEVKLKKIKDRILTRAGRAMAKERHKFMEEFFNRFWEEVLGKK